jgi:hypothetical protein
LQKKQTGLRNSASVWGERSAAPTMPRGQEAGDLPVKTIDESRADH